ncbi:TIGR02186 family protein [Bosea sp. AAP35]|uniref:TIGR02186 family protein n=1 Tax=Bosea sp. AAP35 TaxID=1523417 RepID=UPI0020BF2713|nr:TIGR02186 family protein [Bosea sp. AAP35]
MSSHQILITSNYTGSQLTVFGVVERDGRTVARADPYDIVVTARGPRRMLLVREKERLGPIWINRTQRRFPDSSLFLTVASNRPLSEIMSPETALRERIGLENAQKMKDAGLDLDLTTSRFQAGLIRILEERGLYLAEERGVTFLSSTVFSAPINVPATAPTGSYEIDIVLYAGGVPLARQTTNFEVVKSGMEQRLASGAHEWPLIYGLVTVLMALLLGWLASVVFRRD